ncbi:hypothetical protein SLEP1_g58511 [Rubroshorea leprosula]|uniref:non-specific serine/threonine protein kinase n=1 Tax=Rubroshorea leprosula TaxID=152421 RepID=A0AAV5MPI4_9ROSI|nr:hypothetical protein SLEP1_g58511 [Rubroshorea leprosula]
MKKAYFLLQFSIVLFLLLLSFQAYPTTALSSVNETDKLALLAIKGRITQDIHGIMNSWNESFHFCDWIGVTCSRRHKGRVTLLSLERRGLIGSIPPQIGNLSFLRGINLAENSFQGEIPQEIGHLSRLRFLNLSNNALQGEIPGNLSFCSGLAVLNMSNNMLVGKIPNSLETLGMKKLNTLFLNSNELIGTIPKWLGNASSLAQLSLISNRLHGSIPVQLVKLQNLSYLGVSSNYLSGIVPPAIYNLSSLIFLHLAHNQFHGQIPNDIGLTLPNLQDIVCGGNYFTGQLPVSLLNASQLKEIAFEFNSFSGPVPPNLGRLNELEVLLLERNQLENMEGDDFSFLASLTNCSKLSDLEFSRNHFKGHLPTSIANLSSRLKFLSIHNNQISGRLPDGIGNLIGLTSLSLGENFLTGEIPNSIGRLEKLNGLWSNDNQLSGTIPSSIGNLTQLLYLYLDGNNLEGEIPLNLGNCRHLLVVNLSYNNITGSIPKEVITSTITLLDFARNFLLGLLPLELGNMTNLISLDLSNNRLSGEIPSTLGNCPMMEYLYMQDNLFVGSIPSSLSALKSLHYLDLSRNNLSGQIPKYFQNLTLLHYLNLSFNEFEGEVPYEGVFGNASAVSVVGNQHLCGGIQKLRFPPCKVQTSLKKNKWSHNLKIVIPIVSCSILLAVLLFLIFFTWTRTSKRKASSMLQTQEPFPKISFAELSQATNDFSSANLIGKGSFGSVYKGIMGENGMLVAVKVLNLEQKGASKSFVAECEAMRNIRHRNLIKVLTVCSSIDFKGVDFKAIVYEFMQNGNLDEWLHSNEVHVGVRNFSFIKRLNVVIEVAHAIEYLHYHCQPAIVHGDLKPSNILLDHEMVAHVGDFGLARFLISSKKTISLGTIGTIGYVAPEYGMGGKASMAGDVFSFGILLLEMITGKRPTDAIFKDGLNLHQFAKLALPERVMDIVDPSLLQELRSTNENVGDARRNKRERRVSIKEILITFSRIGILCSMNSSNDRMEMNDVVAELCIIRDKFLGNHS